MNLRYFFFLFFFVNLCSFYRMNKRGKAYMDSLLFKKKQDLNSYIYHISSKSGSGEYALSTILAPGAFARWPLMDRLKDLKMPTVFMCKLLLLCWILSACMYSLGRMSSMGQKQSMCFSVY